MFTKHVPPWIPLGGFVLACAAGCINAVGFLSLNHHAISHMSGNVTSLGIEFGAAHYAAAGRLALVIGGFFLGSVLSGLIVRQSTLQLGRRYGVALACESVLLLLATWFLRHGQTLGEYLAAMACGLQNAMATSYSGAVIRTTHMTGIVTDLGIAIGLWARGQPVERPRVRLYLLLLLGFFLGGVLGALGFARCGYDTLLFPAALTGFGGLAYAVYKHHTRARAA